MTGNQDDVSEITCEQALARVYEYLDGELEPESEAEVRKHLEVCQRCYPLFNFEQIFLEFLEERGSEPAHDPELEERVATLLEEL